MPFEISYWILLDAVLMLCLVELLFHQWTPTGPLPTEDAQSGISTLSSLTNPACPSTTWQCQPSSSLFGAPTDFCNIKYTIKQCQSYAWPGPITCCNIKLTDRDEYYHSSNCTSEYINQLYHTDSYRIKMFLFILPCSRMFWSICIVDSINIRFSNYHVHHHLIITIT